MPGDDADIVAGLLRHGGLPVEPFADASAAGIVRCRGQAEIAELVTQLAQETCGGRDALDGIERIAQAELGRGRRHELRKTLRTGVAARPLIEPALLPDQAREEAHWKP